MSVTSGGCAKSLQQGGNWVLEASSGGIVAVFSA